jgi:hypothetical protein
MARIGPRRRARPTLQRSLVTLIVGSCRLGVDDMLLDAGAS